MNTSLIKKLVFVSSLFIFTITLFAHEFWLQPDKFIYQRGDNINIRFWVGENFEGTNWNGDSSKIKSLTLYLKNDSDDLSGQLSEEKGDSLQFSIYDESTVMVAFNSKNSYIELPPQKFNDYLKDEGLQDALDYRRQMYQADSAGHELYQRSVKTILQIGSKKNSVSLPTNLPLDIIPDKNPYDYKNNEEVSFTILFKKQLLQHQLIKIWQRKNGNTVQQQMTTDENGKVKFKINTSGEWMVSTVNMIHLENNEKADWQSVWGSCTWGY